MFQFTHTVLLFAALLAMARVFVVWSACSGGRLSLRCCDAMTTTDNHNDDDDDEDNVRQQRRRQRWTHNARRNVCPYGYVFMCIYVYVCCVGYLYLTVYCVVCFVCIYGEHTSHSYQVIQTND